MLKKKFLIDESENIIRNIRSLYLNEEGFFIKGQNIKTKEKYAESIVDDFGDYIQYIAWHAKITKNKHLKEWVDKHSVSVIVKHQQKNGLFFYKQFQKSFDLDHNIDTLTGLLELYELNKKKVYLDSAVSLADCILSNLNYNGFIPVKLSSHPSSIADSMTNGSYCEELVFLSSLTNDKQYALAAEKIVKRWANHYYFQKHKLFPDRIGPSYFSFFASVMSKIISFPFMFVSHKVLPKKYQELFELANIKFNVPIEPLRFNCSTSMKKNTMMSFAILSLYKFFKRDIYKKMYYDWFTGVKQHFLSDDVFYDCFIPNQGSYYKTLTKNNSLIESLIDAYKVFNDKQFLDLAVSVSNHWVDKQSNIGFFPEVYNQRKYDFDKRMMLDANTDFSMNLLKLFEITKDKKYVVSAEKCIEAILSFANTPEGIILYVDFETGHPIGERSYFVKTKFNTLFLKLLLGLHELRNDKKIFSSMWSLFRDR